MAKTPKNGQSTKTIGSDRIPAGTYQIHGAIISDEKTTINGEEVTYDGLFLEFAPENGGEKLDFYLQLNGCWRARRGADNKKYQASGSFYEQFLQACYGKSFEIAKEWIISNLKGKKVTVAYTDYPSESGGWAQVPVVNVL